MNTFKDTFTKLTRVHDTSIVFRDWLDYCIDQFLINPNTKNFKHEDYTEEEYGYFYDLLKAWVTGMSEKLESHSWYDLLGVYYEETVKSSSKASDMGQFFTPHDVVETMTELTVTGGDSGSCYDPAGGSGRFCLAYHIRYPEALCFSHDLDEFACKMAVLNFLIHGVKGAVVRCNSISGEFYTGWKVNEFPFTIMEVDNMKESLVFLGEGVPGLNIHGENETVTDCNSLECDEGVVKVGQSSLEDYL